MRIGLVIYGRLDTLTGGYLYDRFLVEALRERGHSVEVISLPRNSYARCLLDNLPRRPAALTDGRGWDLLLQDGLCHPSLILANRRLRARRRTTIVGIVHQVLCRQPRPWLLNFAFAGIERSYFRTADGLLFTSRFTRKAVRKLIGRELPGRVAHPGGDRLGRVDGERSIRERSLRPGPLDLLFVGHLSPVKGLEPLLESLSGLPRPLWRLTVAGSLTADPGHAARIRGLISGLGLGPQVRLLGTVEGERLRALYTAAQLFVMPFALEGFGIAALEAMAFGLPVVGSAAGGVREFVRHGENGFLVAARDHGDVRRRIEELHRDRERLAAMGRAALEAFEAHPGWDRSMRRGCEFLEHVTGADRGRA
jgi:glycosyltransferase involved in cell wall biosynthesis